MTQVGPTIFSAVEFTERMWDRVRSVAPNARIHQVPSDKAEVVAENVGEAEIACIHAVQDFDPALAPNLRWILTASAGVDRLIGGKLWQSDVQVVNASGIHAHSIAELVFGMVIALRHRLPHLRECQRQHVWAQQDDKARKAGELVGLTLGIIGYGSIGREVGRLGKAYRMRLLATKRDPSRRRDSGFSLPTAGDPDGVLPDILAGPEFQRQLMAESDVVVVAAPSSPATRHLVGEDDLRAMKRDAILVNIARGALVDEEALIRALREGWIAGAGLDVFETEPLPGNSPLYDMDNVILTPHVAGWSPLYWDRLMILLAENVRRELAGEPLLNVVDKERGY